LKGTFDALLAGYSIIAPTPTPIVSKTLAPTPVVTPRVIVTPTPYLENQSLSSDLPFGLGEKLIFKVSQNERELARLSFNVEKRSLLMNRDTLVLKASVLDAKDGLLFTSRDTAEAQVDPYTLVPYRLETKFYSSFSRYSGLSLFDQSKGLVSSASVPRQEVPIGTHSLLSFAYAIRSFNLRPSMNSKNPVNDTRVSVFLNGKPYIFTLRPAETKKIVIEGTTFSAQMIAIITGDATLDRLKPKIWLTTDGRRIPLKFEVGNYKAELIR
jgi:hypothetical protein